MLEGIKRSKKRREITQLRIKFSILTLVFHLSSDSFVMNFREVHFLFKNSHTHIQPQNMHKAIEKIFEMKSLSEMREKIYK